MSGIYIHIPFCKSKCKYCSFVSFTNHEKKLGYIFSLLKEIDTKKTLPLVTKLADAYKQLDEMGMKYLEKEL